MQADPTTESISLTIARFDKALHNRSAFSCGFATIDNFLKSSLSDQVRDGMVTAWLATTDGDRGVLGFYTLGAMAVRPNFGPKAWQHARVPDVPVIYIRAVAVHEAMQGRGLGTALVIDAIKRCAAIAEQMGAAAIVLDVLQDAHFERRRKFYADLGFQSLQDPDNPNRVYISMADVRTTLAQG